MEARVGGTAFDAAGGEVRHAGDHVIDTLGAYQLDVQTIWDNLPAAKRRQLKRLLDRP